MNFVARWWRKRQRNIDRRVLFPLLKERARDALQYRQAIELHIAEDPAWRFPHEWRDEESETGMLRP